MLRSKRGKYVIAGLLVGGGGLMYLLSRRKPSSRKVSSKHKKRSERVQIDAVFFKRLGRILRILIPSASSPEALNLGALSALLVARTWMSLKIASIIGANARNMVSQNWPKVFRGVSVFFAITVPAALINASLKWFTDRISYMFRKRLSRRVHAQYISGVNFYAVTNLRLDGDSKLDNVDQRATVDIDLFSTALAEAYTSIFKPTMDVVVFTAKFAQISGFMGPLILYSYFGFSGTLKQTVLSLAQYGRQIKEHSRLEGSYRSAHTRLITNSEEIAFYQGSARERLLINQSLADIMKHASRTRLVKFGVDLADNFLVKYWSTIAGYACMAVPMALDADGSFGNMTTSDLTEMYALLGRYLSNLSTSIGELVMLMNKISKISGYTARVSELLEKLDRLDSTPLVPFERVDEDDGPNRAQQLRQNELLRDIDSWLQDWKRKCDAERDLLDAKESIVRVPGGGQYRVAVGNDIRFEDVSIVSPEGRLLVEGLNFEVEEGQNWMITGSNGSGKSSLFRIIGGLWPLGKGTVSKPTSAELLFVPQKPYLVAGTFRDQIIYPHDEATMKARGVTDDDLRRFLAIVDPSNTLVKTYKFDAVHDFQFAFSGGQKQRVAMARLFYHRPKYAILDECTSAVSSDVEDDLYTTCARVGITLFTVSHRDYLKRHHEKVLTLVGEKGAWLAKDITNEDKQRIVQEYKESLGGK